MARYQLRASPTVSNSRPRPASAYPAAAARGQHNTTGAFGVSGEG